MGIGPVREPLGKSHTVVAAPSGVAATDTAAIQAAIDALSVSGSAPRVIGGGVVELRAGQYVVTGLVLKPLVRLRGQGRGVTTLKLADSSNTDVVKGQNFDSLAGTDTLTGAVYGASVEGLTIDGNKANQSSGRGLAVYGYANRFDDLRVTNCAGVGWLHDSHNTGSFGSDSLATGTMDLQVGTLLVDRCDGGGVDMQGPSDSQFDRVIVAKNGPVSSTTTVGFKNSRNALTTQIENLHVWGNQHKYAFQADVAFDATNLELEGATDSQLWFRSSGSRIANIDFYSPGVAGTSYAIRVGDTAGVLFGGENHILGGRIKDMGVFWDKDSGDNDFTFTAYWNDATKSIFSGTPSASKGNKLDIKLSPTFGGTPKIGTLGSLALRPAIRRPQYGHNHPTGTVGASIFDRANVDVGNISNPPLTGKLHLVRCDVLPGETITNINWLTGSSTAGASLTHRWAALYDTSFAKIDVSADDTSSAWAIDTAQAFTLATAGGYIIPPGVYSVYAGLVIVGTTMPTMAGKVITSGGGAQLLSPGISLPADSSLTTPSSAPNTATPQTASSKTPYVWLT